MSESKGRWILILDDEPLITQTLQALLAEVDSVNVTALNSPEKAVAALGERSYSVVISDFLMPGIDGISFLKKVREMQPRASRILLTGYADKQNAIRSINEVGLYQYIEKPWDNQSLLLVLRNALERASLIEELDSKMQRLTEKDRSLGELRDRLLKAIL
jgi:DNA-binding NtrC family response regulator